MKPRMKSHLGISSSGIVFLITTCNSASSDWHQPFCTNAIWHSPRCKKALFQLMERHLSFSGLCLPDWIVSYNLLIYSQSSLLRREMMPSKKKKHALLKESRIIQMGSFKTVGSEFSFFFSLCSCFPFACDNGATSQIRTSGSLRWVRNKMKNGGIWCIVSIR